MNTDLRRLTSLRFIAALLVVVFHFGRYSYPFDEGYFGNIANYGFVAVSFFFCLSGFIMASVYRTSMNSSAKLEYWLARFARIYPVYILGVVLMGLTWGFGQPGMTLNIVLMQAWFPGSALTVNNPGWSLSVEAFFYVIFPFLTMLLRSNRLKYTAVFAIILWAATQVLTAYLSKYHDAGYPSKSHDFINYFPLMHLNEFMLGCVAGSAFHRLTRNFLRAATLTGAAVLAVTAMCVVEDGLGLPNPPGNGLYAPIFLSVIWLIGCLPRLAILEHPFMVFLGESSYSLYLLQLPVMIALARFLPPHALLGRDTPFYEYAAILICVSFIVYWAVERPARAMIKRMGRHVIGHWRLSDERSCRSS